MARTSLGDQAAEIPFVIPVESAVSTVITFVDSAGDPLDQSGSSWVVEVFATSDPGTALLSITPTVSVGTFTIAASEAAVTAALGSRGQLRWRLRNTSTSQDVLAGDVVRTSRGYGAKVGAGTGVTVQVTETAVTVQGPAATVVAASTLNLGYTASPTDGTVTTSGSGDDATLTLADGTNAGLMAPGDFTKLSGIEDNATDDTAADAAQSDIDDHLADTVDAHDASAISFTPATGIAATDVQAAVVEAKTDAQSYADSAVSTHSSDTTSVHGIADTSALETTSGAQSKADAAQSAAEATAAGALSSHVAAGDPHPGYLLESAATSTYQPLDSDLTAIAALSTTTFGRSLLALANAGAGRTALGVDAAGTDNSTNVTLAGTPDYITIVGQTITRGLIDLVADVTGTLPIANGGTGATTAAGIRSAINVADGAEANTVDSVNSQTGAVVLDADDIDDTSTTNKFATAAQLSAVDGLAATYQPLDSDLTAIAALTTTSFGRGLLALADAAALRTTLGLPEFVVTDIADAQTRINAAEAAGGGVVSFAVGGTITVGLIVDADNVHLRGNGVTLTASGAIDLITLRNVNNCSVDGFRIDGNWQSGRGIVLEGALYCKIGTHAGINGDRFNNWMFDLRADGSATQNTAGCEFGSLTVDNVSRFMHFQGQASPLRPVANNNFHGALHAVSALSVDTIMFDFQEYADNNAFHGVVRIQLQRAGDIGVRYNTDGTMREVYENHFWGGLLVDASNSPTVIDAYNTQHSPVVGKTYVFLRYENGTVSTTADSTVEVVELTTGDDALAYPTTAQLAKLDALDADLTTFSVPASTTISTFGATLVDDVDAATARTTLGLGTIATQAANNVAITGGSVAGITDLAIADGGTGASTAAAARQNLQAMGPVYDVSGYANPEAAHTALKAAGGGILYFPPGAHTIATGLTHDVRTAEDGPLTVIAWGATITYSGSGTMFEMSCPTQAATGYRPPRVFGGNWIDGGSGVVGFQLRDIRGGMFQVVEIEGFTKAVELFNDYAWCELNHFDGCDIVSNRHAIYFNPQAVNLSGNGGTASFARTHVNNLRIGGGETGYALIHCQGGVYDSVFRDIGGNFDNDEAVYAFHLEGTMGGTIIDGIGFEFGAGGSALFDVGTFAGRAPLVGSYRAADPITTYSQDSPALDRPWDAQQPDAVNFITFDATSGQNVSTPDAASIRVTGDIEITARVDNLDLTGERYIIGKWGASGTRAWSLRVLSGGAPRFTYSTDTVGFTNVDATTAWDHANNQYLRFDRVASTGAARFWESNDGITWSQIGTTVAGSSGNIAAGTAVLAAGVRDFPSTGSFDGDLYWVELRSGLGGVVVARMDAADAANITTAWSGDVDGLTWTPATGVGLTLTTEDRPAPFTATNVTTDRSFDADTVTTAELADVVGTLIADLKAFGKIL